MKKKEKNLWTFSKKVLFLILVFRIPYLGKLQLQHKSPPNMQQWHGIYLSKQLILWKYNPEKIKKIYDKKMHVSFKTIVFFFEYDTNCIFPFRLRPNPDEKMQFESSHGGPEKNRKKIQKTVRFFHYALNNYSVFFRFWYFLYFWSIGTIHLSPERGKKIHHTGPNNISYA